MRRAFRERLYPIFACVLAVSIGAAACDKAPLLAPGGTVIFLSATASSVPASGSVDIIATLIEQGTASAGPDSTTTPAAGTPVHNGTLVSFTTTIGRIEPAEAQTQNGKVTVKFIGDGRSGAATILAHSGGARTQITLNVGGAAAERILLTATPLGSSGGSSTVSAKVEDASGNPLAGVSVEFSASRGSLSAASATTNAAGVATVTLTSTVESAVTATVGSKTASVTVTPAARSGLTITPPATITASSTATFNVSVTSGSSVSNVRVNWGDGTSTDLGAITSSASPQKTYGAGGSYTVSATATMLDGSTEPAVSTSVSVADFQVGISSTNASPSVNSSTTFTATTTPNTTNVREYRWNFGDGSSEQVTNGPTVSKVYTTPGQKKVTVTVVPVVGNSRSNEMTVVVQ